MTVLQVNYEDPRANVDFCLSLRETGFAVLKEHPVSIILIAEVYALWQEFFASPQKFEYLFQTHSQAGYFPYKTENAKYRKVSDLKEFYHVYKQGIIPDEVSVLTLRLFQQLEKLAGTLLTWVDAAIPDFIYKRIGAPLHNMIENSENTVLRIIHYPPLSNHRGKSAERAAPHEDINLLTLLPTATKPGLEVMDANGHWHEVSCDPGMIVINVGDMLAMATNNFMKSSTHRVVNPVDVNTSCFSMPFFLHPRKDVTLKPDLTAGDFLKQRSQEK